MIFNFDRFNFQSFLTLDEMFVQEEGAFSTPSLELVLLQDLLQTIPVYVVLSVPKIPPCSTHTVSMTTVTIDQAAEHLIPFLAAQLAI